ncbi:MAG: hypothetical protein Q8L23_08790 [Caulobacter sp.]|nr:hypothetical protein [Caulobacter sp.]
MLTLIFRVFAGILGALGALNIVLLILGEALARYSPVELRAVGTLTEALMIFGVGAGIYVLAPHGAKAHH